MLRWQRLAVFFLLFAFMIGIASVQEASATQKSRTALQTDIDNNKLRDYNALKTYDVMTNVNDSAFNKTTDSFDDISGSGDLTLDDGSGASPSLIFTDESDETATFSKDNSLYLTLTTLAADGFQVLIGNFRVGNGVPDVSTNGEDAYVEGTFEVDGAVRLDGAVTANGSLIGPNEDTTATNVLTSAECGKVIFLNSATEFDTALPAPVAGCEFTFVVKSAPSGAAYTITTNGTANVLIGHVVTADIDGAADGDSSTADDTITFADGVAAVGDRVDLVSDGTSWYYVASTVTYNGITAAAVD